MIAGTSRNLDVTLVDTAGAPIDLTLVDTIVWVVKKKTTTVLSKRLSDGSIIVTGAEAGEIKIIIKAEETAPESIVPVGIGSDTQKKIYRHESRLVFLDTTQEVPGSFKGRLIIAPTDSYEAT